MSRSLIRRLRPYAFATLAADFTVATLVALQPHVALTTVALVMVLVVMFCALLWRSGPALWASVVSVLCFNYFFIPPFHSFSIAGREDLIAFTAFAVVAVIIGQLSARAETRAEQAEARRLEIENLYVKLKLATEEAAEAELLRRSEKLKSALLDAVTHDLRTPLTSIKAAVTTILSELPSDQEYLRDLLQVIDEESDRLNRFIQEMMDLARLEGGSLAMSQEQASVSEIVEIALERAAPLVANYVVEISLDEDLPALTMDAGAISQVLYSLLENSVKYSPGGSRIFISARQKDSALVINVRDEGPGIPGEFREKVFEKFFRVGTGKNARPGFGLGLSIAKGIVEAHGGRIWIDDTPGRKGTSVIFSIPVSPLRVVAKSA